MILEDCTFSRNAADSDGGALYSLESEATLSHCTFNGNFVRRDDGGAIANIHGVLTLRSSVLRGNTADEDGGALADFESNTVAIDCIFAGNSASEDGGAISHKTATFECGGIFSREDCQPQLCNCILWDNTNEAGTPEQAHLYGGTPTIESCCIQAYSGTLAGTNNISEDPLFVAGSMGDYYLSQAAAGQASTSPCCDAGAAPPKGMDTAGSTTRTDHAEDSGVVDIGYHHPVILPANPEPAGD